MRKKLFQLWQTVVGRLWSRLRAQNVLLSLKQFYEMARQVFRKAVARLKARASQQQGARKRGKAICPEDIKEVA